MMRICMNHLAHYETVNGGWFYYASGLQKPNAPSCSFVNAAIVISMKRGQEVGSAGVSPLRDGPRDGRRAGQRRQGVNRRFHGQ
jgi:hypothetical protein